MHLPVAHNLGMTTPEIRPGTTRRLDHAPLLSPRYHLVLLDDDDHSYEYVVEMLSAIFGYAPEKGFAIACIVDSQGRAIVETAAESTVIDHQRAIHTYGADPRTLRCKGSMSAVIEPAQ